MPINRTFQKLKKTMKDGFGEVNKMDIATLILQIANVFLGITNFVLSKDKRLKITWFVFSLCFAICSILKLIEITTR